MKRPIFFLVALCALTLFLGTPGTVRAFYMSTENDAILNKNTPQEFRFTEDDVVEYDRATKTANFHWEWTGATENIDALHLLPGDEILFSNDDAFHLGGSDFNDEDVIQYNRSTGTASVFLYCSDVYEGTSEHIDAFSIYNGLYYISTTTSAELDHPIGSLTSAEEGDLAVYNPSTGESWVMEIFGSAAENIDAVHVLGDDDIILSTTSFATLGGLSFDEDDLVRYNPSTGQATPYFDGASAFSLQEDIDAVYVPLPGAIWLLGSGLVALLGMRRKAYS